MNKKSFVIKADICFSQSKTKLETRKDSYLVCIDGISQGVFSTLPQEYEDLELIDYSGKLVTPGLVDLHVHAPQYHFRGLGMDLELLDWLNAYTFPQEARYENLLYAKETYQRFVEDVRRGPNTRSVVFSTLHVPATILLMDMFEKSGLVTYIGKVNMDRNGAPELEEKSAEDSVKDTIAWIEETKGRYLRTFPIITPRFIPSCTDELMTRLGEIQKDYQLKAQSHLSENLGEIAWVKDLCPNTSCYGEAYDQFGLFGGENCPTIMAHCVWSPENEQELMKKNGVFIAHCPNSNINLASGIAPIRKYMEDNQKVGLGSDVAGGTHTSIFKAMVDAIGVSKLRYRLVDTKLKPLTVAEAFYLGTLGGGEFFGRVGSFAYGYEFDAIVIDDSRFTPANNWNVEQRLERAVYLSEDRDIVHKFVQGEKLF